MCACAYGRLFPNVGHMRDTVSPFPLNRFSLSSSLVNIYRPPIFGIQLIGHMEINLRTSFFSPFDTQIEFELIISQQPIIRKLISQTYIFMNARRSIRLQAILTRTHTMNKADRQCERSVKSSIFSRSINNTMQMY